MSRLAPSPARRWTSNFRTTDQIRANLVLIQRDASACFLAFAAGDTKFATYGAQIGVHGGSDQAGRETAQSGAATVSPAQLSLRRSLAMIARRSLAKSSSIRRNAVITGGGLASSALGGGFSSGEFMPNGEGMPSGSP
jgi:hypothetical protein